MNKVYFWSNSSETKARPRTYCTIFIVRDEYFTDVDAEGYGPYSDFKTARFNWYLINDDSPENEEYLHYGEEQSRRATKLSPEEIQLIKPLLVRWILEHE